MRDLQMKSLTGWPMSVATAALVLLIAAAAHAAAPGITGPSFDLTASPGHTSQPDGATIYTWGYGCNTVPSGFAPATIPGANCQTMQLPGPTLIVTEGDTVSVTLHNNLPAAAGNTSILFPGFNVTATGGVPGLLTQEAAVGGSVSYSFIADKPGTHAYYSGTQGDLQVEMGLYGALIVLPGTIPANCIGTQNDAARAAHGQTDFRLAAAAYNHPSACYDREYLFQLSEIDPKIHRAAEEIANCVAGQGVVCPTNMNSVATEPYVPVYYMVNGRSMPDLMDPNYAVQYPNQPYNGNPHMHPGELVLLRIIGTGRWQHPLHEHGNHVRILARDGNLLLTPSSNKLAGPLLFTTTTTPGQAMDGIFQWTGKGLNWDVYAHADGITTDNCEPDANGYHNDPNAPNYYEWCADHEHPLEAKPFGQVGSGGPVTLPDANIMANGPWYGGSPYLGPEATARAVGTTPIPPSGTVSNDPTAQAAFAYMWHSHNEREITTNDAFPGGMMMMMLVDPWVYPIIEAQ